MRILIDTSVVVRTAQPGTAACAEALAALADLHKRGYQRCIVPQVLYEYWVVATRPVAQNGLGMSVAQAETDLSRLKQLFQFLRDERAIYEIWHQLVVQYSVSGKNAHDARLAAAIQRHQLTHILTFNKSDFVRYSHLVAVTPAEVLAGVV